MSVLLHELFNGSRVISPYSHYHDRIPKVEEFLNTSLSEWNRWDLLYAHEDYSLTSAIHSNRSFAAITLIREPISHIKSCFDSNLENVFEEYKGDFGSFVGHGMYRTPTSNDSFLDYQIRWMAGVSPGAWPGSFYPEEEQKEILSGDLLEIAQQNLDNLAFFGITNHWPETMCLFWYTLDIEPRENMKSYLVRSHLFPETNPRVLTTLEHLLENETLLYDYAERVFFRRYEEMKSVLLQNNITDWPSYCYD